jgi:hypothetical protein
VALERIHVSGPELTERRQPGIDFPKWLGPQTVETTLGVDGGFDETGLSQHAQVLRDGRLRHPKLLFDLSDRLFGRDEEARICLSRHIHHPPLRKA